VVVVNGTQIGLGSTLTQALDDSLSGAAPPTDGEEPPPEGTVEEQIQSLLDEAAQHFAAADEALRAGDLATYQAEIGAAEAATSQAQELLAELLGVEPSPGPSPPASPEPSPTA
jgi:hypothetical protein